MLRRLILKVTKFQLPTPKAFQHSGQKHFRRVIMPPCQVRLKCLSENYLDILTRTVSRDNKQIKMHATYSRAYALWGPVPVPFTYFKPFRSFQCPHINRKKFKAVKVHKSLVIILTDESVADHPYRTVWFVFCGIRSSQY